MDINLLHTEITTDPLSLGYAALVASGSDGGIAALLNAFSAVQISRGIVTTEVFLSDFGVQILTILSDATLSVSFGPAVKMLSFARTIDYGHSVVQGALAKMVQASVGGLTSAQVSAITSRPASRAEILFGGGVVVTSNDIAKALRGTN
jgi:hypothetical protein